MSQPEVKLEFHGLQTSVNDLSSAPTGSLEIADNVVIEAENICTPRRGYDDYGYSFGTALDRAKSLWNYSGYTFAHYSNKIAYSGVGAFTDYAGSYVEPAGFKITSAESNKNLYFTTASGVFKIDSIGLEPKPVGTTKAIHLSASVTGASGFLANNYGVNYKALWGYKDTNSNLVLGAPSPQITIKNAAGASRNVTVRVYIPQGITTSHFLQLHRSGSQDMSAGALPSTELSQCAEVNPTAGNISSGYIDIVDICPDSLRSPTLYTNPSLGGVGQANDQPPLCKVMAKFKDYMIYANTTSKHRYFLRLLGTGSAATSLQGGDTITINGRVYTAGAASNVGTRTFACYGATGGAATTGSASEDIRQTALELISILNQDTAATVYGFYLNDTASVSQGELLIEERLIGGSPFSILVSRQGCWSPSELGLVAKYSKNDALVNRIYYSKVQQPEAVTLLSYIDIGASNKAILAVIPLRESLIIMKEDGCFRLTASLSVDIIDGTQQLIGPATAVALNNAVFALTTQGVVNITDGGAKVIDLPISNDIRKLFGAALPTLRTNSFAIAYETARKYILFLPQAAGEAYCSQALVYDLFTNCWTRFTLNKSCGVLDPASDKLMLGSATRNGIDFERKRFDYSDHVDYHSSQTLSAQTDNKIIISSSDLISPGDMIYQSETVFSFVQSTNPPLSEVTLLDSVVFDVGPVLVYKAIPCKIKWLPATADNPTSLKHYSEICFYFKSLFPSVANATFSSEKSPGEKSNPIMGDSASGGYGLFEWGNEPYGSVPSKKPMRCYITREHQRCSQLSVTFTHSYAFAGWELNGVSLLYNPGSNRI